MTSADHDLQLYNSMGRRLEAFTPAGDIVGLYSCGPTVYAFPHLGNMRAYVFADTLRRALRWKGLAVHHVVNITDVGHAVADSELGEDKMELAATRERRSVEDLAALYTAAFFKDLEALNVIPAHDYPRASHYVDEMIEFARVLEAQGSTYTIPSGLYLDTTTSPGYGSLALMDRDGQQEGARVEHVEGRRHKTDFALWRAEEPGQTRVMRWKSPWGWGAPGWHLECSVMSMALLGTHFDIHTGGVDHRELHHVNEIAQSEAYLDDGRPWVRYWLHNEFLQFNEQKMAKSAGTAPLLTDLVAQGIHPMAYRLFLLGGHYRSQLDFTEPAVHAGQAGLRRLLGRVGPLRPFADVLTLADAESQLPADDDHARAALRQIDAAISADLNTPQVLAVLQQVLRDPACSDRGRRILVGAADALLGLQLSTLTDDDLRQRRSDTLSGDELTRIEGLVAGRTAARAARDWARADELRDELSALGVTLTDTAEGTDWALK